ncbi:MAG: hemerythrin domain-containing protein [Coriobacteriia bacterium]
MKTTIFDELTSEHEEMRTWMKQLSEHYDRSMFEKFSNEIERHMEAEEKVLYEPLRDAESLHDLIMEGYEEHVVAEDILRKLQEQKGGTELWTTRMKVLMESVEHHLEHEEQEMFPKARTLVSEQDAMRMAEEFEKAKKRVPTHA